MYFTVKNFCLDFSCSPIGLYSVPYFAFLAVAYMGSLILFSDRISLQLRTLFLVATAVVILLLFPIFIENIGLEDMSDFDTYKERIIQANFDSGSGINLSDSNILVKVFSYIYRPLFFDAHNTFSLFVSLDNLIWLVLTLTMIYAWIKYKIKFDYATWYLILSILCVTIPLSIGLSNLGIAVRQKTMILPFLYILILYVNNIKIYLAESSPLSFVSYRHY